MKIDVFATQLLPALAAAFAAGNDQRLIAPLTMAEGDDRVRAPEPGIDRSALASALEVANVGYGNPRATELAAKLADPATRVVATGQQAGVLGGPLYTLIKAVAAGLWAEKLEAAGQPAVPVFWIASEDHDFLEVAQVNILGPSGPEKLSLGEDPAPLLPVGMRSLGDGVVEMLDALAESVPGDRYAEWIDTLRGIYRPDARFGEAFSRLMVELLGDRCPLLLDAMLPGVKEAEKPWLRRLIDRRDDVDVAFAGRDDEIVRSGYDLHVRPQPGASPLFLLHGGERRRIEWRGDQCVLRGTDIERPVEWLYEILEENPSVISPGVLARPSIQDAILGTSVQVLGPGELSYIAQAAPLYDILELTPPQIALRPQALLMDDRQLAKLAETGVGIETLVARNFDLDIILAGSALEDAIGPSREQILDALEGLGETAREIDPDLSGAMKKTRQNIERALDNFAGRLASSQARLDSVRRQRLESLRTAVRPGGALQERKICLSHFRGKYGQSLVPAIWEQLELDVTRLQVIRV